MAKMCRVTIPIEIAAILGASYINIPANYYTKILQFIPSGKHYFDTIKQYLMKNEIIKQYIPQKYIVYTEKIENLIAIGTTNDVCCTNHL